MSRYSQARKAAVLKKLLPPPCVRIVVASIEIHSQKQGDRRNSSNAEIG